MFDFFIEGEPHNRVHQVCGELGLQPALLKALMDLGATPSEHVLRMADLATRWGCDASYITSVADGLEARGLAERRAHPTDRRVRIITLTDAGRALRARARALMLEPPSGFGALTTAEQRQLRDLMRKVAAADPALAGSAV